MRWDIPTPPQKKKKEKRKKNLNFFFQLDLIVGKSKVKKLRYRCHGPKLIDHMIDFVQLRI